MRRRKDVLGPAHGLVLHDNMQPPTHLDEEHSPLRPAFSKEGKDSASKVATAASFLRQRGCSALNTLRSELGNLVSPSTLALLMLGWTSVRLCAPDTLHLCWDMPTTEVVFGARDPVPRARRHRRRLPQPPPPLPPPTPGR